MPPISEELARKSEAIQRLWKERDELARALAAERDRCVSYLRQQAKECPEDSAAHAVLMSCAGILALGLESNQQE